MAKVFDLRAPLSAAAISQAELARRLGVDPATVSYWMSGKKKPTADRLPKIAEALNCTIDSLYTPEDREPSIDKYSL